MLATLRDRHSFKQTQSGKDLFSDKDKTSTKNGSTCKTIPSEINSQFASGSLQTGHTNSLLINKMMERIQKMQKAQLQAKEKFEMCISTLTKQIAIKDAQNKKIIEEVQTLICEIGEQKKYLQIIKLYAAKLSSRSLNSANSKKTRDSKREEKQSPQPKEQPQKSKQKMVYKSRVKLFKKATVLN